MKLFNFACSIAIVLSACSPIKTKKPPAFPGFNGRKQFTENGVKTIVNYENGKVVSVVQVHQYETLHGTK